MKKPLLNSDLKLRAAQWADLEPVAQLILDVCTSAGDSTISVPPEELRVEWEMPGFTLETDAWVVTTSDGRVVGFEEFVNRYAHASLQGDGYVHPDFEGRGIGTALLEAVKEVAVTLECQRMWLITTNDNLPALRFYQKRGFTRVQVYPNAVERSRQLKPDIPLAGQHGIPIRDEIELELTFRIVQEL